jgi:hypothetical protein
MGTSDELAQDRRRLLACMADDEDTPQAVRAFALGALVIADELTRREATERVGLVEMRTELRRLWSMVGELVQVETQLADVVTGGEHKPRHTVEPGPDWEAAAAFARGASLPPLEREQP